MQLQVLQNFLNKHENECGKNILLEGRNNAI